MKKNSAPARRYTKAEAEVLEMVFNDFTSSKNGIDNSNYWDSEGAGDWGGRWDIQEKLADGWMRTPDEDDYQSNVKSPMTLGRIEATMQKLKRINLGFAVKPLNSDDSAAKRKAKVLQAVLNNWVQKQNVKSRLHTLFKDALTHGIAFAQVYYLRKEREVRFVPRTSKDLTDEEKINLKQGKGVYRTKKIYDYDDIAIEPVKIQELYWDPSARYLHGETYEAQFIIRRMLPSMAQFKALFSNDPDAKNVDKVIPGSAYNDEMTEFFAPPRDVTSDDYVQVLHYYNKAKDRYVVIANDVVIKDMPLPFDHKMLPFVMLTTYEKPHFFVGAGIPDRLLPIQAEEEYLKNNTYDRLHITNNPMLLVKRSMYGEFSRSWQEAKPGVMLPVDNTGDAVRPLEFPQTNFDVFRAIDLLNRDAVIATQIDPVQMGIQQKYVSATTSMLTKEQMETYIGSLVDSWGQGLSLMGYMILFLMRQYYTIPQVEKYAGKRKNRVLILENMEINPNTFEIIQTKPKDYSFFEIKSDYFDIEGDWGVSISAESMETVSKALEMQKAQANLAQLAPFMVDPRDQQKIMAHPNPYINGPETIAWYLETNNLPEELAVNIIEDEDISIKRAEEQGKLILAGEAIAGIPGEPDVHKRVHVKQLMALNQKNQSTQRQMEQLGPYAAMYAPMMPEFQDLQNSQIIAATLAEHLRLDDSPKVLLEESVIQQAQPPRPVQPPAVPMPPGLNQGGAGQPPTPAGTVTMVPGGNQGMGEPEPQAPTDMGGRPPMATTGI